MRYSAFKRENCSGIYFVVLRVIGHGSCKVYDIHCRTCILYTLCCSVYVCTYVYVSQYEVLIILCSHNIIRNLKFFQNVVKCTKVGTNSVPFSTLA